MQETGVGEITIEEDGMRVSVRRTAERARGRGAAPVAPTGETEPAPSRRATTAPVRVESPMVGTFYRAPAPGSAAFVEEAMRSPPGRRSASSRR